MNPKKLQNVLMMTDGKRLDYLIRKVADFEEIFLIYEAMNSMCTITVNGQECIPVFPEREFAENFKNLNPQYKKVKNLPLNDFFEWLDKSNSGEMRFAVFPDNELNASIVSASDLKDSLLEECEQYE